jgi:dipeptidyl-peptidase-4
MLTLIILSTTIAQEKMLTLEEAVKSYTLLPNRENIQQLQWIPDRDAYAFVDSAKGRWKLYKSDVDKGEHNVLIELDTLNNRLQPYKIRKLNRFPVITWLDSDRFRFKNKSQYFVYDLQSCNLEQVNHIENDAGHVNIHDRSHRIAYTKQGNLYIAFAGGKKKQITFINHTGISYGTNPYRHEFGVYHGSYWSNNGDQLAFYKRDERLIKDYPIVDFFQRPAVARSIKYPMAGMHSELTSVGVYHLKTGSIVWLQSGEPQDQYLTNITWGPDDKFIYIVHLNRDQNHMRLVAYDPLTGLPVKTLVEEKDEQYCEPTSGPIFMHDDPSRFLWFSERSGYRHLYLYQEDGRLIKHLTKGEWVVSAYNGADSKGENLFVTTTIKSPLERHALEINLKSGKTHIIAEEPGTHSIMVSTSGRYIIDRFQNMNVPRTIELLDSKGKMIRTLLVSDNPYENIALGRIEINKHLTDNNVILYSRTIYPPDFDSNKKYPVLVYVYGGPHSQLIRNTWLAGSRLWFHYLAQNGYLIFTLDNRGCGNRGLAFEQATFGKLGTIELEDQLRGIEYLKTLRFVDSTRIGVHGWSYGGFMTTTLKTRAPGVFKVAIAGAPVIDWRFYEVMYTERYMDTPEANPDGYDAANLLNYVDALDDHLFIIHGSSDSTVVLQHSVSFIEKAIALNKKVDYFIYPGEDHGIGGEKRLDLYQRITDYIFKYL